MGELKQKVVKGAIWTVLERFGTQFVEFFVGLVLARLLTPEDFGTVALTAIFFTMARSLVDGGFGLALVQKKDADELDFNSVFYVSIAVAALMYVVMWFVAPWIARFYHVNELVPIVRVSALNFFFTAMNSVQMAELNRKMRFDLTFRISMIAAVTNGVVGVGLAVLGFGVWTIVWSGLATGFVGTLARWHFIAWRPRLRFDARRVVSLISFGWKATAATVLDQIFQQVSGLLIGKFYTRTDLAFSDRGSGLPSRIISSVENTIATVSFPALVRLQDDPSAMRSAMERLLESTLFLLLPLLAFTAVCADEIVLVLFGPKWSEATAYMRIICVSFSFLPMAALNARVIIALGRVDVSLKMSVATKVLVALAMCCSLPQGVFAFVTATSAVGCFAPLAISMFIVRRMIEYPVLEQIRAPVGCLIRCGLMGVPVFCVGHAYRLCELPRTTFPLAALLLVQALVAGAVYLWVSRLMRVRALDEYLSSFANLAEDRAPRLAGLARQMMSNREVA